MIIKDAKFVISNSDVRKCPEGDTPEYAFIGRSNVGKSSLINMLTGRKGLAMTSSTPGKTMLINHFLVNDSWYIVDLPGYGYARRGKDAREKLRAAKPEDKMAVFAVLMRLREICCDPRLVADNWTGSSAKLEACLELVTEAVAGGHRILLFSQFTSMLELLAKRLDEAGVSHFTLQGSTPKPVRAEQVRRFNQGEADVFLISLRAGGTGLNLTAADIVIHYDPWWNLAAQNQATDRAYRIGQRNPVQVYRLIAQDTIEEKIVELQQAKQSLADTVTGGADGAILSMNPEQLLQLLGEEA